MEDKIKELIESAMESGADIKVVKINGNKSKSIKKLLDEEDIIEIFKPVEDVLKECGKEFIKKLNANKRVPSSEEVRKIMDELLGDNKDVN